MAKTKIITGQYVYIEQTAASVVQRGLAWGIDILVMLLLQLFPSLLLMAINLLFLPYNFQAAIAITLELLVVMGYPFWAELFFNGQTFGMKVCRIKVVRLDGTEPSPSDYLLRWLFLFIDFLYCMIGVVFIIFSKNSQRLGDLAAGTTVVKLHEDYSLTLGQQVQFARKDYIPIYPEAAHLTTAQFRLIQDVLWINDWKRRIDCCTRLTPKVENYLNIKRQEMSYERFITNIHNDYQYYELNAS